MTGEFHYNVNIKYGLYSLVQKYSNLPFEIRFRLYEGCDTEVFIVCVDQVMARGSIQYCNK